MSRAPLLGNSEHDTRPGFNEACGAAVDVIRRSPLAVRAAVGAAYPIIAQAVQKAIREGYCPVTDDGKHCVHWWDDEGPCCACGDDTDAGKSDGADR